MPRAALSNRSGITLVELVVVLVVLGLTSALVAPALIFPEPADSDPWSPALGAAVEAAASREQVVRLVVEDDGRWWLAASGEPDAIAEGSLDVPGAGFVLAVSPLGSCGPLPGSTPPFPLDSLTCTPR